MKMKRLEYDASARLKLPVRLESAKQPLPAQELDEHDRRHLSGFTTAQRKQQWLRGRNALSKLSERMRLGTALSSIHPPYPGISLTHNGSVSIAAGSDCAVGIGIDFESWHEVNSAMLRWYLTPAEQARLTVPSNFTRLRLWTIKEALFKANLDNRGLELTDFELDDIAAMTGTAHGLQPVAPCFRYTSLILRQGVLSIAIRE